MTLREAVEGKEYIIKEIKTDDEELNAFLFSLGCYNGEGITVISHLKGGCTCLPYVQSLHTPLICGNRNYPLHTCRAK